MAKSRRAARRRETGGSRWLLWLGLAGAAVVALFALLLANGSAARQAPLEVSGSPRLKVDRDRVDLGDVRLGQPVEVSFELANVGDQPLRFERTPYVEVVEGC